MGNPTTHTCPTCGYTWKHGKHGGHSCSDNLLEKISAFESAFRNLLTRLPAWKAEEAVKWLKSNYGIELPAQAGRKEG